MLVIALPGMAAVKHINGIVDAPWFSLQPAGDQQVLFPQHSRHIREKRPGQGLGMIKHGFRPDNDAALARIRGQAAEFEIGFQPLVKP